MLIESAEDVLRLFVSKRFLQSQGLAALQHWTVGERKETLLLLLLLLRKQEGLRATFQFSSRHERSGQSDLWLPVKLAAQRFLVVQRATSYADMGKQQPSGHIYTDYINCQQVIK